MSRDPEESANNNLVVVCLQKAFCTEQFPESCPGVLGLGRGTWLSGRGWGWGGGGGPREFPIPISALFRSGGVGV